MKDFCGFRFGNIHTKDLNLVVVASSNRYAKNILPSVNNYAQEIAGSDGNNYFGSTFGTQSFKVDIAFDGITEKNWRQISQVFSTDKLQDLVFDELPYKTYKAKIEKEPEFTFICFTDRHTGERVYKGEGTFEFICYFPFALGLNKYIIRAADYYINTPPENIIKKYYNVENNMHDPWHGGYPTYDQVQKGELYFDSPEGVHKLIDVRGYWDNVPEWAESSELAYTPTLDNKQQLMFLPQYSRTHYMNLDTGLNKENSVIGSRLLVYNPGDMPINFELFFDNNERTFWTERSNKFQVRRYNVQRLPLAAAVDWAELKAWSKDEDIQYKYGNRYFKFETIQQQTRSPILNVEYELLGEEHPNCAYIVEPIPRDKLGDFIRLFYWQSSQDKDSKGNIFLDNMKLDYEEGERLADRYEELYSLCINDMERYELYWKTLKETILEKYKNAPVFTDSELSDPNYTYEDFIQDFLYNPSEFITINPELDYKEIDFNVNMFPQFYTPDYLEITTDGVTNNSLILDTNKRMLYNINRENNFYQPKIYKKIYNDNIKKGHWFKIPKGWSLIEIAPVSEESIFGGKTWGEARSFDWGYGGQQTTKDKYPIQEYFDELYNIVSHEFLKKYNVSFSGDIINQPNAQEDPPSISECLNFRKWFIDKIDTAKERQDNFSKEVYEIRTRKIEFEFLKMLNLYWKYNTPLQEELYLPNGEKAKGDISEWWWYACNYMWANFPPLYWTYADILNKIQIKYTPLYY